jgi:hypothetical protein
MSTVYPPRLIRYAFSSKKEREAARAAPMLPGSYGHFPDTLSLFYSKPGTDFLSQHFELGSPQAPSSEQPRQVLNAVTFHKGPGSNQMTIYSTPQHGSSPIAVAVTERRFSSSAIITLPGEAGSSGASKTEHLKQSGFTPHAKYTFTFAGESFEWREDTSKKPTIRTLIRRSAAPSANTGVDQDAVSSKAASIDEGQIVKPPTAQPDVLATWTEGSVPNRQGMLGGLKFSDNGVAAQLGDYFKLLAVSAALVACQHGIAVDGKQNLSRSRSRQS